jgi:hypothetical protein
MKLFATLIIAGSVGILTGFGCALFLQALGQLSAEEDARKEYFNRDPWDVMPDEYDKHKDDNLTN